MNTEAFVVADWIFHKVPFDMESPLVLKGLLSLDRENLVKNGQLTLKGRQALAKCIVNALNAKSWGVDGGSPPTWPKSTVAWAKRLTAPKRGKPIIRYHGYTGTKTYLHCSEVIYLWCGHQHLTKKAAIECAGNCMMHVRDKSGNTFYWTGPVTRNGTPKR